jgi:O-methyltransferase
LVVDVERLKGFIRARTGGFRPAHVEPGFERLYERCREYTMTTPERMYALYRAIPYIVSHEVPGAVVECGVWRGGSCMMSALRLQEAGEERDLYMFDTFRGMAPPTPEDGTEAERRWREAERGSHNEWCYASRQDVERNMLQVAPAERLHLIEGKVEDTLPEAAPESIALLRLDTDWYESTKHELEHLYPRLSRGGVLILDDYGHWQGMQQAVDEYFGDRMPLLNRIDRGARIAVKVD